MDQQIKHPRAEKLEKNMSAAHATAAHDDGSDNYEIYGYNKIICDYSHDADISWICKNLLHVNSVYKSAENKSHVLNS